MKRLSPLFRISTQYGAIAGVLGAIIVIGLYYIGNHPFLFPVYFDFRIILFFIFIFFSLKEYRDFYNKGTLYFWEGIVGSLVFVTVFALLASLLIYAFGSFNDEFVKSFIRLFTEQVNNFPKEVVEQIGKENLKIILRELPATTSYDLARKYLGQSYAISFFVSVILSVILRKQPKI
jgi:hypothetical protein